MDLETSAYRLNADVVWRAFQNSGKRHMVLTGMRGCGKTTLMQALFEQELPGITTWAEPGKAVYLKENRTERTMPIGVWDPTLQGTENKMVPCLEGFLALGIPALENSLQTESEWIGIDEIGFLEANCTPFHEAVRRVMEQKRMIAVVRQQDLPFLNELRQRDDVFLVDLDAPFGKNGCVIMASGLGKRFGGNKLLADFKGKPLINCILEATEGIFAQRVVVTRHSEVAELCRKRGIAVVLHDQPNRNDTVRLGLEALENVESCMFCPGDQPLLKQASVAALALAIRNQRENIWRAAYDKDPGSPVVFPKWAFPELMNLPEGKGGGVLIKKYPERLRKVKVQNPEELQDVDCPEDLADLMKR